MGARSLMLVTVAATVAAVVFLKYEEWLIYPRYRAYASAGLKDQASAKFRSERLTKAGALCGEMSAKNGYGAYTGFKRFIAQSESFAYVEGLGFVGVQISSRDLLADLDSSNATLRGLLAARAPMTQTETEAFARKAIFEKRWSQMCD